MNDPSGGLAAGIGTLRWLVTLCRRDQAPDDDLALRETLVPLARVHADIQPTYASTFYQSTQVDTPITHMVNVRWRNVPTNAEVVVRSITLPDGTQRSERYHIRRTKEVGGRKRFIQMECELEVARSTPDDSDATRNVLLTEPYDGDLASLPGIPAVHRFSPESPTLVDSKWDEGASAWDGGWSIWDQR